MADDNDLLHPARRFMHVCYVCYDVEAATTFLAETLGLREVMRTPSERVFDNLLGFEREVESPTVFMYDHRGPRVSPSVEVQQYVEPPTTGTPSLDAFEIGLKSLGFTVPSVDETLVKLLAAGCKAIATEASPFGTTWTTVVDPNGITLELVEDPALTGPSQMRHLRITVSDLSKSVPWYKNLGFAVVGQVDVDSPSFLGHDGLGEGKAVRMRLPDEPFEVILIEWTNPKAHGAHYPSPNHAGLFRCALQVFDTIAATDAMKAAGTEFVRGPVRMTLNVDAQLDMWLSFLADPDGILYEFVGRPPGILKKV
jgi:catechol 2,3-dioxygenase-like lactoylglutathione lyase family enzyme